MSTVATTSTKSTSMSIALKTEAPTVTFKKRRQKLKRPITVRYEPYPEVVIRSNQKLKSNNDEVEEGEIVEEEAAQIDSTNLDSSFATSIVRQRVVRQRVVRQISQLVPINEPCPAFSITGTCTSICPKIHDNTKTSICPSLLQQKLCEKWSKGICKLTHEWTFHVAPSCIGYLLGICYTAPCCFAHNDHVCAYSAHCERFKALGYCEKGAACSGIHLVGDLPQVIIDNQLEERARKLELAKQKAKTACLTKRQLLSPATTPDPPASPVNERPSTARKSLLSEPVCMEEVEEVLGGEKKGEFALQDDFIPFC